MIVGLDDTDSRDKGMCTTYLATLISEELSNYYTVTDRFLFRLNPNVPFKTRGNACLSIHIEGATDPGRVWDIAEKKIEENAVFEDTNTNPGLALYPEDEVPSELKDYTLSAVKDVLEVQDARDIADKYGIRTQGWENSRGVIGAVAAIGAQLALDDETQELLTYRDEQYWKTPREVSYESFFRADEETTYTWDTVDHNTGSVVSIPNTDGPVVYGVRGTLEGVLKANQYIEAGNISHATIFRTNQGTDMHLIDADISDFKEWRSYRTTGTVTDAPEMKEGGHAFFELEDETGCTVCAAFEPTKRFRHKVTNLREGDVITVCGGYKNGTLNIEKFKVETLNRTKLVNPTCPDCGNSMSSAGRNQGYRCRDCSNKVSSKVEKTVERNLNEGSWYEVPPGSRRHLSKPLVRDEL